MKGKKVENFDPEELAKECDLNENQKQFADLYMFVTGLDAEKAVQFMDHNIGKETSIDDPEKKEQFIRVEIAKKARKLISHPNVIKYINGVRENISAQLVVDKLWVEKKLKHLADNASEKIQFEATKTLAQILDMLNNTQKIEITNDPSEIAKAAFEKRKQMKIVEFKKKEEENVERVQEGNNS